MSVLRVEATDLAGLWVVEMERIGDERGWFARVYDEDVFGRHGLCTSWNHHGESHNPHRRTLRGMHYQADPHAQAKLVRCERGALYDVALDVRPNSPTYGRWFGIELRADRPYALYIAAGFAHGYQTLSDDTTVHYLLSKRYVADAERGIAYDSPQLAISWPLTDPIVGRRDAAWPAFGA